MLHKKHTNWYCVCLRTPVTSSRSILYTPYVYVFRLNCRLLLYIVRIVPCIVSIIFYYGRLHNIHIGAFHVWLWCMHNTSNNNFLVLIILTQIIILLIIHVSVCECVCVCAFCFFFLHSHSLAHCVSMCLPLAGIHWHGIGRCAYSKFYLIC